jgi:hypothetical protein
MEKFSGQHPEQTAEQETLPAIVLRAQEIMTQIGFVPSTEADIRNYYTTDSPRELVIRGTYNIEAEQKTDAQLKVVMDPRGLDAYTPLRLFHQQIKASSLLTAPVLLAGQELKDGLSWTLTETIGEEYVQFPEPLSDEDRAEFFEMYTTYRAHFPQKAMGDQYIETHGEPEDATTFQVDRFKRWRRIKEHDTPEYNEFDLDAIEERVIEAVTRVHQDRPMEYIHGHFKVNQVFRGPNGEVMLTDFDHAKFFPQGYELAFIGWSEAIMPDANWALAEEEWIANVEMYRTEITAIAEQIGYTNPEELIRVSMIERVYGTFIADNRLREDLDPEEKKRRANILLNYLDILMK